jgi:integrase
VKADEVTQRDKPRAAVHGCYFLLLWYVGCRQGGAGLAAVGGNQAQSRQPRPGLWYRRTSQNSDPLEVPLSSYGIEVLNQLRTLAGGEGYVFPSQRRTERRGTARNPGRR